MSHFRTDQVTDQVSDQAAGAGYRHEAVFYRGADGLLAEVLPFVREGVDRGEPVMVAMAPEHLAAVEGALGEDATRVDFVDMSELGANPACVIPEWRRFLADIGDAGPVRGVGEPVWPGRRRVEVEEALLNEALFDLAFDADTEMSMLCPYDVASLPGPVVAEARRVHPPTRAHEAGPASPGYSGFRASLPPAPASSEVWEFGVDDLTGLRHMVARLAGVAGLGRSAADDLVLAAHELATNSIVHGGGWGSLRSWTEPDALVVEIRDSGVIDDPLVGREMLDDLAEHGRGVWLANQLCDLVQVRSGEGGTVVRLFSWL